MIKGNNSLITRTLIIVVNATCSGSTTLTRAGKPNPRYMQHMEETSWCDNSFFNIAKVLHTAHCRFSSNSYNVSDHVPVYQGVCALCQWRQSPRPWPSRFHPRLPRKVTETVRITMMTPLEKLATTRKSVIHNNIRELCTLLWSTRVWMLAFATDAQKSVGIDRKVLKGVDLFGRKVNIRILKRVVLFKTETPV